MIIKLPDGSVATTTTPSAGMTLHTVNTRIRLFDSGANIISATIIRNSGGSEYAEKQISVTIPSPPPTDTSSGVTDLKARLQEGAYKLLFSNDMATIDYIDTITITTDDGVIRTTATPCVSKNPYFAYYYGSFTDPQVIPVTDAIEYTTATTRGSCSPAYDSDSDGMPDTFELQHNFNLLDASDADTDADGDGYSNLEEYKAGTNPLEPNSIPSKKPMTWLPILLDE